MSWFEDYPLFTVNEDGSGAVYGVWRGNVAITPESELEAEIEEWDLDGIVAAENI